MRNPALDKISVAYHESIIMRKGKNPTLHRDKGASSNQLQAARISVGRASPIQEGGRPHGRGRGHFRRRQDVIEDLVQSQWRARRFLRCPGH